jgi:hypothetical protein
VKMGTMSVPETLEEFYTLTRQVTRAGFSNFVAAKASRCVQTNVVLTKEYNVMARSEEFIGTTLTLSKRPNR